MLITLCIMVFWSVKKYLGNFNSYCRHRGQDFILMIILKRKVRVLQYIYSTCVFWINFMAFVLITFFSINFPDGTRDNDWTCPKCGNVNFSFRTVCNMRKCNTPKPGSQVWLADMFQDLHLIIIDDFVSFLISTTNFLTILNENSVYLGLKMLSVSFKKKDLLLKVSVCAKFTLDLILKFKLATSLSSYFLKISK